MCSGRGDSQLRLTGFPIRKPPDQSLVADSPGLIAGAYVLHRLLVPRHPPCALNNLATTDDARVHYAVLKIQTVPAPRPPPTPARRNPRLRRYDAMPVCYQPRRTRRKHLCLQDPTACPAGLPPRPAFLPPEGRCTNGPQLTGPAE